MRSINSINDILEFSGIRVSPVRCLVLKTLLDARHPLSSLEIERALETVDRSSITRTLVLFVERGVVHSFEDGSGSMKYEACRCSHENAEGGFEATYHDTDLHPHFHCVKCGKTICLEHASIPEITLPEGFERHSSSLIIKGLCDMCR